METKAHPFGAYIRKMREDAVMSRRKVAATLEISPSYLRQVEVGEREPLMTHHWDTLARTIPGVTVQELRWLALRSTTAKVMLPWWHKDHAIVRAIQGGLSDEERAAIRKILSNRTSSGGQS